MVAQNRGVAEKGCCAMTGFQTFLVHKKYGTIKRIPKHAAGWMNNTEWAVYDHFPTEQDYFAEMDAKPEQSVDVLTYEEYRKAVVEAAVKIMGENWRYEFDSLDFPDAWERGMSPEDTARDNIHALTDKGGIRVVPDKINATKLWGVLKALVPALPDEQWSIVDRDNHRAIILTLPPPSGMLRVFCPHCEGVGYKFIEPRFPAKRARAVRDACGGKEDR